MKKHGFTLIEMLVVVGIIAMLMSLLLPALAAARSSARTTKDASNLKQLTFAWLRYQQAKDEGMMPYMLFDTTMTSSSSTRQRYWFGRLTTTGTSSTTLDFSDGLLAPYLEGDERVFVDPDFGVDQVTETRYKTFTTSYGYNQTLSRGTSCSFDSSGNINGVLSPGYTTTSSDNYYTVGTVIPPVNRNYGSVQHTAKTIVFADSAIGLDSTYSTTGLRENWCLDAPAPGSSYYIAPTVHYRHKGQVANISFSDGHVEQVLYTEVPTSLWNSYGTAPSDTFIAWFKTKGLGFYGFDNTAYNPSGEATGDK